MSCRIAGTRAQSIHQQAPNATIRNPGKQAEREERVKALRRRLPGNARTAALRQNDEGFPGKANPPDTRQTTEVP